MPAYNPIRGEVLVTLAGQDVRVCVTLAGLAAIENRLAVVGLDALAVRLQTLSAADLAILLDAVALDPVPDGVTLDEAISAVTAAFEAMTDVA